MNLSSTHSIKIQPELSKKSEEKIWTTWMGDTCQCQRQKIKAPMMCMNPEDSGKLYGPIGSGEESFVDEQPRDSTACCCFSCAQKNRASDILWKQ